ncbi:BTAD domain-containing putative transcriptional regulator [Actinoplanes sp. NPDC049118]|uniref:AfsR/SARP family transcriptional regulator n=1 Tax=Actinoplanes sp. NPDC049118 TaxID=3155769 RepID=UPI0033FA4C80
MSSVTEAGRSPEPTRFSLLGPVRAWRGGAPVDLGPPQRRAVLAVLLLRLDRPVTVKEVIAAVWGATPPSTAAGSVQTHVSLLRSTLEPTRSRRTGGSVLQSVAGGYRIGGDADLDLVAVRKGLARARAMRAAGDLAGAATQYRCTLDLWYGEPLADVPGPAADAERRRLGETRLEAVEERLEVELRLRRFHGVVSELAALTAAHPVRERLRVLQLQALHGSGRRAEALAAYAEARRVLARELGVEPGGQLRRLYQFVLADERMGVPPVGPRPSLAGTGSPRVGTGPEGGQAGAVPARVPPVAGDPAPPPAQLPAPPRRFTGRRAELHRVLAATGQRDPSGLPLVLVTGMAGVGKTALALRAAHELRDQYPDGQLFARLHGCESAADPAAVLAGFLRALGAPPSAATVGPAERSALYRTLLADRRVLIVLDDAHSAEQVAALLPGSPRCGVLVTARRRLAELEAECRVELTALTPDDSLALLCALAGPTLTIGETAALRRLGDACHGLPLALRAIGARLVSNPQWSAAALATRLSPDRPHLVELRAGALDVAASLDRGYRQLDPYAARVLRLLALPGPRVVTPQVAAAVLGDSAGEVEAALDRLADRYLLESPEPGRFAYHRLVQLFARQLAAAEDSVADRDVALLRFAHHHLRPDGPEAKPGPGITDRDTRDWLDRRRAALVGLVRRYGRHPGLGPGLGADLLSALARPLAVGAGGCGDTG